MARTGGVSRNFDLLAPHYRWMERVLAGSRLQDCRTKYLTALADAKKVLLLGEGHGRFLCELLRAYPNTQVTCLDSSARMLDAAREALRRTKLDGRTVNFLQADVFEYPFPCGHYDAVATHFFLDCFRPEQLQELVRRIARGLSSGGLWLLADFRLPQHGPQRLRATIILKSMYLFFRVATRLAARHLTHPDLYLQQNGLALVNRHSAEWGLLHTDLWRKT